MCFTNECDWTAEVSNERSEPAEKIVRCDECHRDIQIGATVHHIGQQEYELCHACEFGECKCAGNTDEDGHECTCEEPEYGETFHYDRCDDCDRFLKAVEAAEIEAGCKPHHAVPLLLNMIEDIREGGTGEAKRYWKKAVVMFPELRAYLAWLWREMFV